MREERGGSKDTFPSLGELVGFISCEEWAGRVSGSFVPWSTPHHFFPSFAVCQCQARPYQAAQPFPLHNNLSYLAQLSDAFPSLVANLPAQGGTSPIDGLIRRKSPGQPGGLAQGDWPAVGREKKKRKRKRQTKPRTKPRGADRTIPAARGFWEWKGRRV